MGKGQNVPPPTRGFFFPRNVIFQRRASFCVALVTVHKGPIFLKINYIKSKMFRNIFLHHQF
jgi:hypothetical protein